MRYYVRAFQNYVNFEGRDSRKQYWLFALINLVIVSFVTAIISMVVSDDVANIVSFVYSLVVLLPSFAISIRRMHDIGKSGWWILVNLVPLIGWIWYLILLCTASQQGDNKWGSEPVE